MAVLKCLDFDLLFTRPETGYGVPVLHAPADADRAIGDFQLLFMDDEIRSLFDGVSQARHAARRLESSQIEEGGRQDK